MEDWHNMGPNYDPTLMAWFKNFDEHWGELKAINDKLRLFIGSISRVFRSVDIKLLSKNMFAK
jgi:cyclopropane-fatty-acyl-phospholipid synthase